MMNGFSLATPYSFACAFLPCLIALAATRKNILHPVRIGIMIFCLYLWLVYDLTTPGGLEDIFFQLQLFKDLDITSFSDLYRALHTPNGTSVFRSRLNLSPIPPFNQEFFLNICMTIPLGFMLPLLWQRYRRFIPTLLCGAGFSLLIECSQLLTSRTCDINDFIANTCGTALGFVLYACTAALFGHPLKKTSCSVLQAPEYIILSFLGMFFLYHPFKFYALIGY